MPLDTLMELAQTPTAAGRETRVLAFIERWLAERPGLTRSADAHGNITIGIEGAEGDEPPVYLTAHLDHPAFVVDEVIDSRTVRLAFRGGVMNDYFHDARVRVYLDDESDRCVRGVIRDLDGDAKPFKLATAVLDEPIGSANPVDVGMLCVWDLPGSEVLATDNGAGETLDCVHTPACDDLAALAAALDAMDRVLTQRAAGDGSLDLRLLLTRAEEIGFIGAIGACKAGDIPMDARLICLENSRSFPHDSPIGGGPIVRVGDRVSVFDPDLTAAVAKVAEDLAGGPAAPTAAMKKSEMPSWKWQRKLMAGGACEASVFCAYGYSATCVCLPLGNYHNMADLAEVQAGTWQPAAGEAAYPKIAREYIAVRDYEGMVDLLAACGTRLPAKPPFMDRLENLWTDLSGVLSPASV